MAYAPFTTGDQGQSQSNSEATAPLLPFSSCRFTAAAYQSPAAQSDSSDHLWKTSGRRVGIGGIALVARTHGEVKLENGFWRIKAEPHIQLRMKRVFGRIGKNQHGVLAISNTTENCR